MAKNKADEPVRSGWREIAGILTGTVGLLMLLAVLVYNPGDIELFCNQPSVNRWVGRIGAGLAFRLFMYFGVAGYLIPLGVLGIGLAATFRSERRIYPRALWFLLGLFCLAGLLDMQHIWYGLVYRLNVGSPGGLMGELLAQRTLGDWIGHAGAGMVFVVLLTIAAVRMFDLELVDLAKRLWKWIKAFRVKAPTREEATAPAEKKKRRRMAKKVRPEAAAGLNIQELLEKRKSEVRAENPKPVAEKAEREKPKPAKKEKQKPGTDKSREFAADIDGRTHTNYKLPSLDLLDPPVPQGKGMSAGEIADTAEVLQSTLEEFGVEARVTGVQQGPVVTCYEIEPAAGVRVERIKALADNIALKMHAESIRIQAPIPGKGVCGVEVPNTSRASVFFRDLVESSKFRQGRQALPLVLGKDVNGDSMIYDLAKMPHLLIAGATGSGKSVCMNSILTGLLMKHSPDDLRLILVDPKTVEFQQYNNLPHLVVPVITNPKKVALGLRWAIDEMERRYKWFNQTGVRDLPGFNARALQKQEELFGDEVDAPSDAGSAEKVPETLPYIVIVIDELADLMAVAQQEVEAGIARLAAKSRAAGIHMILATQRPDVKVITGTIKANFPVRIAFKVSQGNDSRTILDRVGAEKLLGKGDMLVVPPGSDRHIRSQGAFTSDGEIERVTSFCKDQCKPEFIAEIHEKIEKPTTDLPEVDSGEDDEILAQAIEVIRQTKRASTSSLQRRLRIGYTRAARVMDLLEERGMIGPPDGAGPREILIDLDGEIPQNPGAMKDETD
jgi:S-DNA-T family DNA segregation ATPase FtsK/SpoIIIE